MFWAEVSHALLRHQHRYDGCVFAASALSIMHSSGCHLSTVYQTDTEGLSKISLFKNVVFCGCGWPRGFVLAKASLLPKASYRQELDMMGRCVCIHKNRQSRKLEGGERRGKEGERGEEMR